MTTQDTSAFRSVLESAKQVTLVVPQKPFFDFIAAALGLKIVLEAAGKQVQIVSPDPALVEFNRLVGIDTLIDTFGSRDLIISFPGQTEHVDKVSYNLNKGELQLVISPKPDSPELDYHQLKFIAGVSRTDLLITVGVRRLSDLGSLADQAKELFSSTTSVLIHNRPPKEKFTTHEICDLSAASVSELITQIVESAGLKLDQDSASNLLLGLEKATDNFQRPAVSAATFEAAVVLMRRGAKRNFEISASQFPPGSVPTVSQVSAPADLPVSATSKPQTPSSQSGYGTDSSEPSLPNESSLPSVSSVTKAPADWYEPKVFKGPTLP